MTDSSNPFAALLEQSQAWAKAMNPALENFSPREFEKLWPTMPKDLMELSGKARAGELKGPDMQGATFTISSLGGIGGTSFTPIVNAPEVAILGLTRKLAYEEGPNGIAVNSVCPGTTFTERVETRFRALDDAEQTRRMDEIPLRRAARPEEIAACILFLASDDASYVTGAALDVNGGSFMS